MPNPETSPNKFVETTKLKRASLRPLDGCEQTARQQLSLRGELTLALMPTLTVLAVFALVEYFDQQRLLFVSLAATAFSIYHDPHHKTNHVATVLVAQIGAAVLGIASGYALGFGYLAGGVAMIAIIVLTLTLDRLHAPAVTTALSFAFRVESKNDFPLFAVAVGLLGVLVLLQRAALQLVARAER